jgi:hypothetical protein
MNNALIRAEMFLGTNHVKTKRDKDMLLISKDVIEFGTKKEMLELLQVECNCNKFFWDTANETMGWLILGSF